MPAGNRRCAAKSVQMRIHLVNVVSIQVSSANSKSLSEKQTSAPRLASESLDPRYQSKDLIPLKGACEPLRVTSASFGKIMRHSGLKPEKSSTSFDSYSISSVTPHLTGVPILHLMAVREPPRLNRGVHLVHFLVITKATVIRCHP